jgi:putative ABC transport system permease protein
METLFHDIRQALRLFKARPVLVGLAAASFALAIAGNVTIFGVVDAVVLHPFPYPDADRLVTVGVTFPRVSAERRYTEALSPAEVKDIRESRTLEKVGAFDLGNRTLAGGTAPAERVFTALVLTGLFETIGMRPTLGRDFLPEELGPGGPPAAIISHRVWQNQFGGDPSLVGQAVRVNGRTTTLVGVMPPGLLLIGTDLWIPWGADPATMPRNIRQFTLLARLAPGTSLAQADAELATIAARVADDHGSEHKEYGGWRLAATPWAEALSADFRMVSFAMLGAVALVLLVACANVANLLVAHASGRQREIAVRLALGSGRLRLARQFVIEGLLISTTGGIAALALSSQALGAITAILPERMAMLGLNLQVNGRVLLFSLAVTLVTGVLCGLVPAVHASGINPLGWLQSSSPTATSGRRGGRMRRALVVSEVALSLALLAGAGLFIRTTDALMNVDPGFDASRILTMRLTLPREKYQGERVGAFFDDLIDRVGHIPGVVSVGAASQYPPAEFTRRRAGVVGREGAGPDLPSANVTVATPGSFGALGMTLRAGRLLAATDRENTPSVAVVNEAFARRFLAGADPLRQRIRVEGMAASARGGAIEVVGIVADTRNAGLRQPPEPEVFLPVRQDAGVWNQLFLLVGTRGDAMSVLPAIRREVTALDRDQPIYAIQTIEDAVATSILQQRLSMVLLSVFSLLALVLAGLGIYGVVSQAVTARTREIGVRMAFGAGGRNVVSLVLRQVMPLVAAGWALGIGLAFGLGRLVSSLLHGVTAADPTTMVVVSAVLALTAVAAAAAPARRASRLDPMVALRHE